MIIHTDPDEVEQEVNYLDNLFLDYDTNDLFLMGDLNASPSEFDELLLIPDIEWVVEDGKPTNVRETKTYDNILFNNLDVEEYIGGAVYNFTDSLNLTQKEALKISDHFPVYMKIVSD